MHFYRVLVVTAALAALTGCQCGGAPCKSTSECPPNEQCVSGGCEPSSGDAGGGGGGAPGGGSGGGLTGGGGGGGALAFDAGPPACGDKVVTPGEGCDDGNLASGDGCSAHCLLEPGWKCPTAGAPCTSAAVCGDGAIGIGETCDDRNAIGGDGCSATCTLEPGWSCPTVGIACVATRCGDGLRAGLEECDDGATAPGDGCGATCLIEEGWGCGGDAGCVKTVCGNGLKEGIEQCDDGNHDLGDGCDVYCHTEPDCTDGVCVGVCGDGVRAPSEACDDGNTRSGDGCSSTCTVEKGFACVDQLPASQDSIAIPIVYRDFLPYDAGTVAPHGHIDFDNKEFSTTATFETGIVLPGLSDGGKPVYNTGKPHVTVHGEAGFDQWYRDDPTVNRTVVEHLTVVKDTSGNYVFADAGFFPLDGRGWQTDGTEASRFGHNFNFTSELRYWFNYAGGEHLQFIGDDDVFVYVNRQLAVDLGGVHGPLDGGVTLDAAGATRFGLKDGGVYEVVVFQAERHVTGSNYKLTLRGFNAPRSACTWTCGDGVVTRFEVCDDGANDGGYGGCLPGCLGRGPYCGDGHVDADAGEVCDDGVNAGAYGSCAPGCTSLARCGDGILQISGGEQCDDGNTTSHDGCDSTCHAEIN